MKLTLTLDMNNAAFDDGMGGGLEAARLLDEVSVRLREGAADGRLVDYNGNAVGSWAITDTD